MNDSKSQTDISAEESNQLTLGMAGSGPRKSVARLRPMRSIANALGAVMRSRPSKVSVNFGMHLSHDNDSRKSSKIGTLGMTRRKMLDPKMELKQDRIDQFLPFIFISNRFSEKSVPTSICRIDGWFRDKFILARQSLASRSHPLKTTFHAD